MWKLIRDLHLWSGVFALAYLAIFAWSGLQIAKPQWFHLQPSSADSVTVLPPGLDAGGVAEYLRKERKTLGDVNQLREAQGVIQFRLASVGRILDVRYEVADGKTILKTNTMSTSQMINRMHFIAGLWHETREINWMGALAGLVSAALLIMGVTGMMLWFRMRNERLVGTVLIAGGLVWGLGLIVAMRMA
jgi:hypothetical protein